MAPAPGYRTRTREGLRAKRRRAQQDGHAYWPVDDWQVARLPEGAETSFLPTRSGSPAEWGTRPLITRAFASTRIVAVYSLSSRADNNTLRVHFDSNRGRSGTLRARTTFSDPVDPPYASERARQVRVDPVRPIGRQSACSRCTFSTAAMTTVTRRCCARASSAADRYP